MNEAINYVITRMAAERGISSGQMRGILEEAIHAGMTSSDSSLRSELLTRFGGTEPSAEELIEEIAKMFDAAHHNE